MPSTRFRNVCFTWFPDDNCAADPPFKQDKTSYLVAGRELCPSTGRPHWQCYAEFKNPVCVTTLRGIYPGAHFERRRGTATQAAEYCKKDDDFKEFGEISNQGRRSDLQHVSELVSSGESNIRDIVTSHPRLFVQYHRGLTALSTISASTRIPNWRFVKVHIIWGDAGTGKTRYWFERFGNTGYRYQYSRNGLWWDGYMGEPHVLFDEFECQVPMSTMLQWMDGYPVRLEVKGGHTWACWKSVTIITNHTPQTFYSGCSNAQRRAFARRVTDVTHYTCDGEKNKSLRFDFDDSVVFVTGDANV